MENGHQEYERLIKPIEDRMIRTVWRIVLNSDDADDAFQDALMIIWKKLNKIRRHPNPHALILRVCANSAYDILRRKARYSKREELDSISSEFADIKPAVDEEFSNRENQKEILFAISKLSRNQAVAVTMRFIQELPYSDIADALGCRKVTARKHVTRAREKLQKLLSHLIPSSQEEVQR